MIKIKTNAVSIINEILEKSFVLSTIKTDDYTSFEFSLRKNAKDINRTFIKSPRKQLCFLSTASVRSALTGEEYPGVTEEDLEYLGGPKFIFQFIEEKKIKNTVFIIKDYEMNFAKRKDNLNLYHTIEEYYPQLQKNKNKIVLLSKSNLGELRVESENDFKDFVFSNEGIIKEFLENAKEVGLITEKFFNLDVTLKAFKGLTYQEVKNIVHDDPNNLEKIAIKVKRERIIAMNKEIQIIPAGKLNFEDLIGLDNFKIFMKNVFRRNKGKAAMLLGPPGNGKSFAAKTLGGEFGLDTIVLNIGSLMNKFVGESESITRRILKAIDDYGDAIVFIDEFDKGMSGMGDSGGDSGVSKRLGGQILSWMNDREDGKGYVICTANNVQSLPKEYLRSGRFDILMWVDYPEQKKMENLIKVYSKKFELKEPKGEELKTLAETFAELKTTGAEVEAICKLSYLLGLSLEESGDQINRVSGEFNDKEKKKYMRA